MNKLLQKPTHVYVGRDSGGCVLAIHSDYGDKDTGKAVAEMITGGLTVDRVDWDGYCLVSQEENFLQCGCPKEPELQPTLFAA